MFAWAAGPVVGCGMWRRRHVRALGYAAAAEGRGGLLSLVVVIVASELFFESTVVGPSGPILARSTEVVAVLFVPGSQDRADSRVLCRAVLRESALPR